MEGERRLFLGELPLRGAAGLRRGGGGGLSTRVRGKSSGARGCMVEGRMKVFLGEMPLRDAARMRGGWGGDCRWGSSRCARLLDRVIEETVSGGVDCPRGMFWCSGLHDRGKDEGVSRRDAAARGCPDEGGWGETVAGEAPAARGCLIE